MITTAEEAILLNLPPIKAPAPVLTLIRGLSPAIQREMALGRIRAERGLTDNERQELAELLEHIAKTEDPGEARQFPEVRINPHD